MDSWAKSPHFLWMGFSHASYKRGMLVLPGSNIHKAQLPSKLVRFSISPKHLFDAYKVLRSFQLEQISALIVTLHIQFCYLSIRLCFRSMDRKPAKAVCYLLEMLKAPISPWSFPTVLSSVGLEDPHAGTPLSNRAIKPLWKETRLTLML